MPEGHSLPPTYVKGFHDVEAVQKMRYSSLGKTDMMVSQLSLGASHFGAISKDAEREKLCIDIVSKALRSGVNYIDTAPWMGNGESELLLGRALRKIPRQAYYLATKVGRYQNEVDKMFDFTSEKAQSSVHESLRRLGVKYLDLVQIHDVEFCASIQQLLVHTIPALVELKKAGKIKHIGITGYALEALKELVKRVEDEGTISVVLSHCRATLFDRELLDELPFFSERGVGVINSSPLAMGLLSTRAPAPWHPAGPQLQDTCQMAALHCKHHGDVDVSKLAMHWSLRQSDIATTLVSVASLDHLEWNLAAISDTLTEKEERLLEEIEAKYFKPLKSADRNWLQTEVVRYWTSMKQLNAQQPMEF